MLNVRQRQLNLRTYHYFYSGKIDGIEGSNTKNAYRSFQKYVGITVDGIYGKNTNAKLIEVIKDLQGKLNSHGYSLTIDGIAGINTISAITIGIAIKTFLLVFILFCHLSIFCPN